MRNGGRWRRNVVVDRRDDDDASSGAADADCTARSADRSTPRRRRRRRVDANHLLPGLLQPAPLLAVVQLVHHVRRRHLRPPVRGDRQAPARSVRAAPDQLFVRNEDALRVPLHVDDEQHAQLTDTSCRSTRSSALLYTDAFRFIVLFRNV